MNEYDVRQTEIQSIVESRQNASEQKQVWEYKQMTGSVAMAPRFKYQNVEISHKVDFIDDLKGVIFDTQNNPKDSQMLSNWSLKAFQEKQISKPEKVPPMENLRSKSQQSQKSIPAEFEEHYGTFLSEGIVEAKSGQISYVEYHYNLRSHSLFFYPADPEELEKCESQIFSIMLNERTYDYLTFVEDNFLLKSDEKTIRIKKTEDSQDLISRLQKILLRLSMRGSFSLRDEVPPWRIEDYLDNEIQTLGPIHFQKEGHLKVIQKSKYYKETLGAFFFLLKKESVGRKTISAEVLIPGWLKQELRDLPDIQHNLITNVVPTHSCLQMLKIKVAANQVGALTSSLKHIFPFFKSYVRRTFVVYESELSDEQVKYMFSQISYPMHMIGFPHNDLSIASLENCIEAASNLYHESIDYSYNSKLTSVGQSNLFNLINTNPSIKKITLKGCYVQEGEEYEFFEALTNNLCLEELEMDFLDHYGNACSHSLRNYDAYIY